jgi:SAM-dependent methyltransferase
LLWNWKEKKPRSHTFWSSWKEYEKYIPKRDPRLLDIGCGIRPRIPIEGSYFLDLSEPAIDSINRFGGKGTVGDATRLPYKKNFFDFVNASELLEHVDEDVKVFGEVSRVLKKEGHFAFAVPVQMKYWTRFDDQVNHVRRYEAEELIKKTSDNDFKIKRFLVSKPRESLIFKEIEAVFLKLFPRFSIVFEEYVMLPVGKFFEKTQPNSWKTGNFKEELKEATRVIIICQKV